MLEMSAVQGQICHRTRNNREIVCIVLIASYIVEGAIVDLHVGGVVEHDYRRARSHVVFD